MVWIVAVVIALGTVALFSRGFGFGFTNYDDPTYVTSNPHVQGGLSWPGIVWAFTGHADYWHPLAWISHQFDWQLYRDRAAGHHVSSALWHGLNAALFFLLTRKITRSTTIAAFAAAFFAWHPLRVESVIWVTERKDVMSGAFFLLTLLAYLAYGERRRRGERAIVYYIITLALYILGLMSKPSLVPLPAVLCLLDFWPLGRTPLRPYETSAAKTARAETWTGLILEKIPFAILSVAIAAVTVRMQRTVGAFTLHVPFADRVGNAFVSIARYLGKIVWPFDLAVCYPHPGHWPLIIVVAAAALTLAITVFAWLARERQPWWLVGWAWFLVMLAPSIGLVQVGFQAMADRYSYIPAMGLTLAGACACAQIAWAGARAKFAAGIAGALALALGARTWNQEGDWRSPEVLFQHALAVTRDNYVAHFFLGMTEFASGRLADAERECEEAIAINPKYASSYDALGLIRRAQGRVDDAIQNFQKVLELAPRSPRAEADLGELLLSEHRLDEAARHLHHAAELQPDLPGIDAVLATLDMMQHHADQAVQHYTDALARYPNSAELHYSFGILLLQQRRMAEAKAQFEQAIRVSPQFANAYLSLGDLLAAEGQPTQAIEQYRRAVAARPLDPGFRAQLATALEQCHDATGAEAVYRDGIKLQPENPELRCRFGELLAREGKPTDAKDQFIAVTNFAPNYTPAYICLARLADATGHSDEASAYLEQAGEKSAGAPAVLGMVADQLAMHRRFELAEKYYRSGIAADPKNAELHAKLGFDLMVQGRRAEAIAAWEEALKIDPNFPNLRARVDQLKNQR